MNIGFIPYRNAKRFPEKIALVDEEAGKSLTWKAFNDRVNRLANALADMGYGKGEGIGVHSRNCLEILEVFFACGKLGMVFQPMNWPFRPEEVAYGLNDGKPSVVVVHREFHESFKRIEDQCSSIKEVFGIGKGHGSNTDYEALLAGSDPREPEKWDDLSDDDVVFICYTGGTSGISKGAHADSQDHLDWNHKPGCR